MDVEMMVKMGAMDPIPATLKATREIHRTFEVQAVGPTGPTQVQVSYRLASSHEELFGQTKDATLPVQGNSYVVTLNEFGKVSAVTGEAGAAVAPGAERFVMDDNFFSNSNLSINEPSTQSFEIGQSVTEFTDLGAVLPRMGPNRGNISAVVSGARKDDRTKVAAIDLTLSGTMEDGPMTFQFDGTGELLLNQKRGFIHSFTMDAPITMGAEQAAPDGSATTMQGKGTLSMQISSRMN